MHLQLRESSQDTSPTSAGHDKVPRSISRLYLSGSSKRPRTNENTALPEAKPDSSPEKMKNTLEVSPTGKSPTFRDQPASINPDHTFMEQIGEFDHDGWMRKKGERYNTWKLRYFVLKGPHLYYLREKGVSSKGLFHKSASDESMCARRLRSRATLT